MEMKYVVPDVYKRQELYIQFVIDHDTTGFYMPSMAYNALPRHPWRGIVVCGYNSNSH